MTYVRLLTLLYNVGYYFPSLKHLMGIHQRFTLLVAVLLLPASVFAQNPIQIIDNKPVSLEHYQIGYFIDPSETMELDEVQQQEFTLSFNKVSLGTAANTTWIKIELQNDDNSAKDLYLHHTNAFNNRLIELHEVTNNIVTNSRMMDMNSPIKQPWMFRGSAIFDIILQPHQQTTLYVKNQGFSHQWFELNLYDKEYSKRSLISLYSDIYLFTGMLLALIIFNFLLFFSSRLKEHFFYACYLISGACWIMFTYGLLADVFNVYGFHTLKWHLSLIAMPVFLLLFMTSIFDTKSKYPIEHWALVAVMFLLLTNFIYGLFDIVTVLKHSNTVAIIVMLMTVFVTVSMLIRRHPDSLFFLLGHGLFVIFSTLAVLFYDGKVPFNYINSHGVGIGIILEALMLSFIMAHRMRSFEKLKVAQVELQILASTDPLTQLFNRRYFGNAAAKILYKNRRARESSATAIAIIDIDHFKSINDTYGHSQGDTAIKLVADIIKAQTRNQDVLARYGGEEFIILMPHTHLNEAYVLTERIRTELEETQVYLNKDTPINFTISAGIAAVDNKAPDLKETIEHADKALYRAKKNGRNQSQLFTD